MIKGGYFITFEGIEGVGKSTQIEICYELLSKQHQNKVVLTREPGGTATGELIRELVLKNQDVSIGDMAELLLIFAARAQHLEEVICPALAEDKIVLCDRFTDATYAYQGIGRGLGKTAVATLEQLVQAELRPDLTVVLDMPVELGMQRVQTRGEKDRFESEQQTFFQQIRQAYLSMANEQPARVYVIDASNDIATVSNSIKALMQEQGLIT